jgi:hypothetical protein
MKIFQSTMLKEVTADERRSRPLIIELSEVKRALCRLRSPYEVTAQHELATLKEELAWQINGDTKLRVVELLMINGSREVSYIADPITFNLHRYAIRVKELTLLLDEPLEALMVFGDDLGCELRRVEILSVDKVEAHRPPLTLVITSVTGRITSRESRETLSVIDIVDTFKRLTLTAEALTTLVEASHTAL